MPVGQEHATAPILKRFGLGSPTEPECQYSLQCTSAVAVSGDGAGAEKLPPPSSNFPLPSSPSLTTVTHATASSACHVGPDHDLFDRCVGSVLNIICYLTYRTPTRISVYICSYTSMPFTLRHFLIVSSNVICHPLTCELRVSATSGLHFGTRSLLMWPHPVSPAIRFVEGNEEGNHPTSTSVVDTGPAAVGKQPSAG